MIPAYLIAVVLMIVLYVTVLISWFAILITAHDPFTEYKKFAMGWQLKFMGLYLLVIEDY
jgi:hypothetical protein